MAAERCASFIAFRLIPARGTAPTGKLDQRTRCFSSLNANRTVCRYVWSRVPRKAFAALTIFAVGLWLVAPETGHTIETDATTQDNRAIAVARNIRSLSFHIVLLNNYG